MSTHSPKNEGGFSLVELMVVIALVGVIFASFGTFFTDYLTLYFGYQKDANNFSELAEQSQRVSDVARGIVDIISASPNDLQAYAYFAPTDAYTSVVHYYLSADQKSVKVDVTPMTANPPVGTLVTTSKKTYTIITDLYLAPGGSLFKYYDNSGAVLTPPIANQHTITEIGVNLAVPGTKTKQGQQMGVTVSLRNRKTNL